MAPRPKGGRASRPRSRRANRRTILPRGPGPSTRSPNWIYCWGTSTRGDLLLYQALTIQRAAHDLRGVGESYWSLGRIAFRRPETAPVAAELIEHGLAIARALGDQPNVATRLVSLGQAMRIAGDASQARAYWEESLSEYRRVGVRGRGMAACLCHLAGLGVDNGELATAGPLVEEALGIAGETGDAPGLARALEVAAAVAAASGTVRAAETSLRLAGAAAATRGASAVPLTWYQADEVEGWLAPAREWLGERSGEVWAEGEASPRNKPSLRRSSLLTDGAQSSSGRSYCSVKRYTS